MIRVFCFHYNNPELLSVQYKALRRYFQRGLCNIQLDVVIDAPNNVIRDVMEGPAGECYGTENVHFVPQHLHNNHSSNPSMRNCVSVNWAYQAFAVPWLQNSSNAYVLLLDGDCFPIDYVNPSTFIANYHIVSRKQTRGAIEYCWIGFVAIASSCPDVETLRFDLLPGLDSGGRTSEFLRVHPTLRVRWVDDYELRIGDLGGNFDNDIALFDTIASGHSPEILDGVFYHMRSVASNWRRTSNHIVSDRLSHIRKILCI